MAAKSGLTGTTQRLFQTFAPDPRPRAHRDPRRRRRSTGRTPRSPRPPSSRGARCRSASAPPPCSARCCSCSRCAAPTSTLGAASASRRREQEAPRRARARTSATPCVCATSSSGSARPNRRLQAELEATVALGPPIPAGPPPGSAAAEAIEEAHAAERGGGREGRPRRSCRRGGGRHPARRGRVGPRRRRGAHGGAGASARGGTGAGRGPGGPREPGGAGDRRRGARPRGRAAAAGAELAASPEPVAAATPGRRTRRAGTACRRPRRTRERGRRAVAARRWICGAGSPARRPARSSARTPRTTRAPWTAALHRQRIYGVGGAQRLLDAVGPEQRPRDHAVADRQVEVLAAERHQVGPAVPPHQVGARLRRSPLPEAEVADQREPLRDTRTPRGSRARVRSRGPTWRCARARRETSSAAGCRCRACRGARTCSPRWARRASAPSCTRPRPGASAATAGSGRRRDAGAGRTPSRRPESVHARHAWIVSAVRRTSSSLARDIATGASSRSRRAPAPDRLRGPAPARARTPAAARTRARPG